MRRIQIAVCFCLLALPVAGEPAIDDSRVTLGDPMPVLVLPRGDDAAGEYDLDQLKGRPAVVVFWRPGQSLSLDALRDLREIQQDLGGERVGIVAVDSARSSPAEVQAALEGEPMPFPVLLDPERDLYGTIRVIVSPTTFLIDAGGVMRFKLASHPEYYRKVIGARLRHLLGDIDQEQMMREIEPTVHKIDQDLAAAWRMYNLGRKLQAEGKPDDAVALFEKAVAQYPSLPEARCALGFMRLSAGDLEAADEHFRTALTYQPAAPLARLGQAVVLARAGRAQQAEPILLSLLGQNAIAVRVRYELGRLYRARGADDEAVAYFEDALSLLFPEAAPAAGASAVGITETVTADTTRAVPAVEPIVPPSDAEYVGTKTCKKCHFQQWKSWKDTKMAHAFDALAPGAAAEVKVNRRLDPRKDYTTDAQCLGCHTTGFGYPGGYQVPAPGDDAAARAASQAAGVSCESCHGPGTGFQHIHKDIQDNKRPYQQSELLAAGQYEPGIRVCAGCHTEEAPCIPGGYLFDYEQRKEQGTHKHYPLKFRSEPR